MSLSAEQIKTVLEQIIEEQGPSFVLENKNKAAIRNEFSKRYPQVSVPQIANVLNAIQKERGNVGNLPNPPQVAPQFGAQIPAQQIPAQQIPAQAAAPQFGAQIPAQQIPAQAAAPQFGAQIPAQQIPAQAASSPFAAQQIPAQVPSQFGISSMQQIAIAKRNISDNARASKPRASTDVTCADNIITNNNIRVNGSRFNSISTAAPETVQFAPDAPLVPAVQSMIDLMVPSISAQFWAVHNAYSAKITELNQKLKLQKGTQTFTYVENPPNAKPKKNAKAPPFQVPNGPYVTYTNPLTNTKAVLEPMHAQPIIDYHAFMSSFTKDFAKKVKYTAIQFLKEPVVNTQNIFKLSWQEKIVQPLPENTNKLFNFALIDEQTEPQKSDAVITNAKPPMYATDYCELFVDIRDFDVSKAKTAFKNIYAHRCGIVGRIDDATKLKLWKQALANIRDFDPSMLESQHERDCLDAWKNVLSSRFAYHVVMDCIPASPFFEKAFTSLITEGMSVQLFATALYPISFAFTPYMLYSDDVPPIQRGMLAARAYKDMISNVIYKLQEPGIFDYTKCNWVYYLNKEGVENEMVRLLEHSIRTTKTTEAKDDDNIPADLAQAPTVADAL